MSRFCVIFTAVAFLAFPDVFLFPTERRRRVSRVRRAVSENDAVPRPELPTRGAS
jgi:hypothetical protein